LGGLPGPSAIVVLYAQALSICLSALGNVNYIEKFKHFEGKNEAERGWFSVASWQFSRTAGSGFQTLVVN
jgi:hypothetical protein